MIGEWVEQKELRGERTAAQLYEATRDLPRAEGDRTRKTIMMDPRIGEEFDVFSDKVRMDKSDLVSLALYNLMRQYRA